jgi:Excalibur calcium-binding domain
MTDPYGPWDDDDADELRRDAPSRRSLRALVADVVRRYQSARLGTQVTIDILAACLVMAVVVAGALLVDDDQGPSVRSAGPSTTVAHRAATTTSTVAPTTAAPTTAAPTTATTTLPPATTTTRVPRTTTSAPPAPTAPPATDAPAGPPPSPPPSTTGPDEGPRRPYRDCMEAWLARALPLYAGEPGYSRELDRDGDGEACEWDEQD